MLYKIYLITNTVNGKKYVGQTRQSLSVRWYSHQWNAKHPSKKTSQHLYNAMRKYGIENFEISLLEDWTTIDEANDAERWWIKILDTTNPEFGYNGLIGGHFQPSPEVGKRISEGKKKSFSENPELRENIRKSRIGMKLSAEHKQNISKAQIGQYRRKNKPFHSSEDRLKISESLKAYHAKKRISNG